jgi:hypothetical protein
MRLFIGRVYAGVIQKWMIGPWEGMEMDQTQAGAFETVLQALAPARKPSRAEQGDSLSVRARR